MYTDSLDFVYSVCTHCKLTVMHRNVYIHCMLIIRANARPLRTHKNIRFHEYSIFNFTMDRCILHLLGQNTDIAIWRTIFFLIGKNLRISESMKRIFYRFRMHTARRHANQQGKKMSGFRGRRRAVGPIYNNGYTTQ